MCLSIIYEIAYKQGLMPTEGFCFTAMHLLQSYGCFVKIKKHMLLDIT